MSNEIDRTALAQEWVHSHEEDTDGEMVFRPASYRFPPSRGRKSFWLDPGGQLGTAKIGPDDRYIRAQGGWHIDAANKLTLEQTGPGTAKTVMQIISVGPDKLVVKKE
jgi:hypothetical protein